MNETNELLEYIYKDCEMGKMTLSELLEELEGKDNKIKGVVEDILKEYEDILKESKKVLKNHNIKPKKVGMMEKMGAKEGIKVNVKNDNSDSKISDMVIQGLVMGIVDISKRIDNFKDEADKDIIRLADKLLTFQENSVDKLKEYL